MSVFEAMKKLTALALLVALAACTATGQLDVQRAARDVVTLQADAVKICTGAQPLLSLATFMPDPRVQAVAVPLQLLCTKIVATGAVAPTPEAIAQLQANVDALHNLLNSRLPH